MPAALSDAIGVPGVESQAKDFTARYYRGGKMVAAASAGRDLENLQIEAQLHG